MPRCKSSGGRRLGGARGKGKLRGPVSSGRGSPPFRGLLSQVSRRNNYGKCNRDPQLSLYLFQTVPTSIFRGHSNQNICRSGISEHDRVSDPSLRQSQIRENATEKVGKWASRGVRSEQQLPEMPQFDMLEGQTSHLTSRADGSRAVT